MFEGSKCWSLVEDVVGLGTKKKLDSELDGRIPQEIKCFEIDKPT